MKNDKNKSLINEMISVCCICTRYTLLKRKADKWIAREEIARIEMLIRNQEENLNRQLVSLNKCKDRLKQAKIHIIKGFGIS